MNMTLAKQVLDTIKAYDRIIIFRHFRPDGDAVGSTRGLQRILQLSFPEKEVVLQNCDSSDYMSFLGDEEPLRDDAFYADALGIVVDTATTARISNQKFSLCKKLIKIDHHIPVEDYGDINWVIEEKSSSCEMVAQFYHTFRQELKINKDAATYISAVVHVDEKTPHMHLIFVPLTPDNRLSAKTIIGNRKKLTQWQDEFHAHMVKKYPDFERGESASSTGRVHMTPQQYKTAIHLTEQRSAIIDKIRSVNVFNMKALLPEILADMDEYIRGAEGFKTQLVKVARKNKDLEAEVASLEKQLESETQSVLQELQEKQRLLELEEKERQLQNIPQEIIDRYNSADAKLKKMEDIAYE